MMKLYKNVLIIGGLGNWSQKTYIPALKAPYFSGKLYICDIKENIKNFNEYLKLSSVDNIDDIIKLKKFIKDNGIKIVIISTPPEFHYYYLKNLVECNVDIICDKPLIAVEYQSSDNVPKEILGKYLEIYKLKENYKITELNRSPIIFSPLRRRLQSFYKAIYDNVEIINKKYNQNITFMSYYENDGCHRWDDEMEFDFAHGYSTGLGKVSHTGYHILDIVSALISDGCSNIKSITCQCLDENIVENNHKSRSNKILQNLLNAKPNDVLLLDSTKKAELDISLKYTIKYFDDNDTFIYLFFHHSGVSQRTTVHYSQEDMGDQGRTDDSHFFIEQGALQNIYGSVFADSSIEGSNGNSVLNIKTHNYVAKQINKKQSQIIKVNNIKEKSTVKIVQELLCAFNNKNLLEEYRCVEYNSQLFTMELYVSALYSKINNKQITWEIGKLYDNLY